MRHRTRIGRFRPAAGLACAVSALWGPPGARAQTPPKILRTLVYVQLSSFTAAIRDAGAQGPIVSKNGNQGAYSDGDGAGGPAKPNRIFVFNATSVQQVDAYPPLCACGSMVDLSDDGSKAISSDGEQIRIADSGGARPLLVLDGSDIISIRISGDGSKVFFLLNLGVGAVRDATPRTPLERGVWVINVDGSGLRQIVGPAQVAPVLGVPAGQVGNFGTHDTSLDVSRDGSHIIFNMRVNPQPGGEGQGVFTVNLDGTNIHDYLGRVSFAPHVAISGDGSTVAFDMRDDTFHFETDVAAYGEAAGKGRHKLYDHPNSSPLFYPNGDDRMQLSSDGSRLLLGSTSYLFNTDGSGVLQLATGGPGSMNTPSVVGDGMYRATMDAAATRFLYLSPADGQGVRQLAVLDINPTLLGKAPAVSNPSLDPAFVLANRGSTATVSVKVDTSNPSVSASFRVLHDGLDDSQAVNASFGNALFDDGKTAGDSVAGDGVFTNNDLHANVDAVVGPRTVRIKAETIGGGGKRRATAIDVGPLMVMQGTSPASIPGDVNGDGKINVQDAILTLQIAVALATPTAAQRSAADVNGDGKVDVRDAVLILRKAVGL